MKSILTVAVAVFLSFSWAFASDDDPDGLEEIMFNDVGEVRDDFIKTSDAEPDFGNVIIIVVETCNGTPI